MKTYAPWLLSVSLSLASLVFAGEQTPGAENPPAPTDSEQPATAPVFSDPLSPRQEVALRATERLDQIDDKLARAKAICDESSVCLKNDLGFAKLAIPRGRVLTALAELRDPQVPFETAEQAVGAALTQYDGAVQALARAIADLLPRSNS